MLSNEKRRVIGVGSSQLGLGMLTLGGRCGEEERSGGLDWVVWTKGGGNHQVEEDSRGNVRWENMVELIGVKLLRFSTSIYTVKLCLKILR